MLRNVAIAGYLVLLAGLAGTPAFGQQASESRPSRVVFISGVKDEAGTWVPRDGDSVPFLPDRSFYGWVAEMPSDKPVMVKEVLSLPARAKHWPSSAIVSADGRTGTLLRTRRPENGQLVGAWTVAEGDPLGEYRLTVSIGDETYTFNFSLVPAASPRGGAGRSDELVVQMRQMVKKREQMEGLNTACFEGGWGWKAEYGTLSREEVLLQIDSLVARHENRVHHFERCLQQLRSLTREVAALARDVAEQLRAHRSLAEDAKLVALVDLSRKVSERYAGAVTDVYPWLLDVERGYVQYFRRLRATRARGVTNRLSQPEELESLEGRIITRMRQDATRVADETELYHAIAPSATSAARVAHAKIQAALYSALDKFGQSDARTDLRKLRELREEINLVVFMVYRAASNEETQAAVPAVSMRYRGILEDLKEWIETLRLFDEAYRVDMSTLSPDRQEMLVRLIDEKTKELERVGDRIDRELHTIDRMLVAAAKR
jgi:hypothetical protein